MAVVKCIPIVPVHDTVMAPVLPCTRSSVVRTHWAVASAALTPRDIFSMMECAIQHLIIASPVPNNDNNI